METHELLRVYESVASLTAQMAKAAFENNWTDFEELETQCARHVNYAKTLPPTPLQGASLTYKIRLVKEIMANDRSIREITEPWQHQLPSAMRH